MKILKLIDYPNFLEKTTLSSSDIAKKIENYTLEFPKDRNEEVEWKIAFPKFIFSFYQYVFENKAVPEQETYFKYYILKNKDFFVKSNFSEEIIKGLKARIFRAYPSLVRDLHFAIWLDEKSTNAKVIFNRKLDVEEDVDVLIILNSKFWGIHLFADTPNAWEARKKKQSRHTKFDNVNYIDVPIKEKGSVKCGSFWLYGEREFQQIVTTIKNIQDEQKKSMNH